MPIDLPAHLVGSGTLDRLVNIARDYAAQSYGTRKPPALSVASIERRLSGPGCGYPQRGSRLERKHARPPV